MKHDPIKLYDYFCVMNQGEMTKWLEALRMASLVQRAPG